MGNHKSKIPKCKSQIPKCKQISSTKDQWPKPPQSRLRQFGIWVIGIWKLFVIWCLLFGFFPRRWNHKSLIPTHPGLRPPLSRGDSSRVTRFQYDQLIRSSTNHKSQKTNKPQAPNSYDQNSQIRALNVWNFGHWNLVFVCDLMLVIWNFPRWWNRKS